MINLFFKSFVKPPFDENSESMIFWAIILSKNLQKLQTDDFIEKLSLKKSVQYKKTKIWCFMC
jgi:hypothetical protein